MEFLGSVFGETQGPFQDGMEELASISLSRRIRK